jgi:hypothetical protein
MKYFKYTALPALALGSMLLLSACSSSTDTPAALAPASSAPSPSSSVASVQASSSPTTLVSSVPVSLTEFKINAPASLPAGSYAFQVSNAGTAVHALAVNGPGVQAVTANLNAGDTAVLTANLTPGTYLLTCPIPGHVDKGMALTLTVT